MHDTQTDTPLNITTYNNTAKTLSKEAQALRQDADPSTLAYLEALDRQRTYYYHRDHLGSITALSDEEGNIVESLIYDESYGTILTHKKTEETYNPYCYTAREFDSKNLYYYRGRYYNPNICRFISSDPIEFMAGDVNFYRYVGGDPVNFRDPSGLMLEALVAPVLELSVTSIASLAATKVEVEVVVNESVDGEDGLQVIG